MNVVMNRILQPDIMPFILAIVIAIVVGAIKITRTIAQHRERMAMIGMGIDPDTPVEQRLSRMQSVHSRVS